MPLGTQLPLGHSPARNQEDLDSPSHDWSTEGVCSAPQILLGFTLSASDPPVPFQSLQNPVTLHGLNLCEIRYISNKQSTPLCGSSPAIPTWVVTAGAFPRRVSAALGSVTECHPGQDASGSVSCFGHSSVPSDRTAN